MQEVGVVLHNVKQLRIESSGKPSPRGTQRDKMAANSRRRKKARNKRYWYKTIDFIFIWYFLSVIRTGSKMF